MKKRIVVILILCKIFFATTAVASNASATIVDGEYLKYRLELIQEALSNPLIAERLQNVEYMMEINELLKIENKLRRYRESMALMSMAQVENDAIKNEH